MNVLIIGGSGHVSGAVARAAVNADYTVWTVTRGKRPTVDGVHALIVDRHDHEAMAQTITGDNMIWDLVVDCICFDEDDIRQDMALFGHRAKQFVFISTDFVYDPAHRTFPQREDTSHYVTVDDGTMDYGRKKRLCEQALIDGDTGDMAWTILRPCHIYGPTSELGCLPLT